MKRISLLSFFVIVVLHGFCAGIPRTLQEACDSLDYYIRNREKYFTPHERLIDSLTVFVPETVTPEDKVALYNRLAEGYHSTNLDSAIVWYGRALEAGNMIADKDAALRNLLLRARLRRDALLPIRGITFEAIADFEKINPDSLVTKLDRKDYFQGAVDIFTNISSLYPEGTARKKYVDRTIVYIDSLLKYYRPHGLGYRFTNAHRWKMSGENSDAIAELIDTMPYLTYDFAQYASGASILAKYYSEFPSKSEEFLYYQTLSAINDIKGGHREVTSMQRLGKEWYERGDVERAYKYLSLALSDAVASGSSARVLESAQSLPLITRSFQERDRRRTYLLVSLVIILIVALVIILGMTAILRRDHRKSENLRRHLTDLNQSKDFYIQNILMLCSVFFERLEEFNRYVGRKIKANQVKDLYDSIESRKYLASQTDEFFKSFDTTFRTIHPNFMRELNSILRPDRQLPEPPAGESMTPEMRIVAFMRLGIDDSAILAKFLGLSLNTIYTYRNRLKNRAKNRETFDDDIKKVGF